MPNVFRVKPKEVLVEQWRGTPQGATPIIQWVLDNDGIASYVGEGEPHHNLRREDEYRLHISEQSDGTTQYYGILKYKAVEFISLMTKEGFVRVDPGWFIILDDKGSFSAVNERTFLEGFDFVNRGEGYVNGIS